MRFGGRHYHISASVKRSPAEAPCEALRDRSRRATPADRSNRRRPGVADRLAGLASRVFDYILRRRGHEAEGPQLTLPDLREAARAWLPQPAEPPCRPASRERRLSVSRLYAHAGNNAGGRKRTAKVRVTFGRGARRRRRVPASDPPLMRSVVSVAGRVSNDRWDEPRRSRGRGRQWRTVRECSEFVAANVNENNEVSSGTVRERPSCARPPEGKLPFFRLCPHSHRNPSARGYHAVGSRQSRQFTRGVIRRNHRWNCWRAPGEGALEPCQALYSRPQALGGGRLPRWVDADRRPGPGRRVRVSGAWGRLRRSGKARCRATPPGRDEPHPRSARWPHAWPRRLERDSGRRRVAASGSDQRGRHRTL